jgi:hypothetical protein
VTLGHVRLAAAYREAHPDEIDEAIAENRCPLADVGVLFPFVAVADLGALDDPQVLELAAEQGRILGRTMPATSRLSCGSGPRPAATTPAAS